jgi:hypothetical protein
MTLATIGPGTSYCWADRKLSTYDPTVIHARGHYSPVYLYIKLDYKNPSKNSTTVVWLIGARKRIALIALLIHTDDSDSDCGSHAFPPQF